MTVFKSLFDGRLSSLTVSGHTVAGQLLEGQPCPDSVLDTLSLANAAADSGTNLVVTVPSRDGFGSVLAVMLALDKQTHVNANSRLVNSGKGLRVFQPKERLKMGNAVVEYVRSVPDTGDVVVRYNPTCPIMHTLTREQSLQLQKTDSNRPLSPSKKFSMELKTLKAKAHEGLRPNSILDEIRQNKTYAISTIAYVGQLARMTRFCTDTLISGVSIAELMLCARVDWNDTEAIPYYDFVGRGQYCGVPALAIAYDLKDVTSLSNDDFNAIKIVIIDADNPESFIERNLEDIRLLTDSNVPMLFVASNAKAKDVSLLRQEGFIEWRWDRRTLGTAYQTEITPHPNGFFNSFNQRCDNCASGQIQVTACNSELVNSMYAALCELDDALGKDCGDEEAEDVRQQIWMTALRIMRAPNSFRAMTHLPCGKNCKDAWSDILRRRRGRYPLAANEPFNRAISIICSALDGAENPKERLIWNRISALDEHETLAIVVRTAYEAETAVSYWEQRLDSQYLARVGFIPVATLKARGATLSGRMLVMGWLGREIMANIVYGYDASLVELLLYQGCETDWYMNQVNAWKRDLISRDDSKMVFALPKIESEAELDPLDRPQNLIRKRPTVEEKEEEWRLSTYRRHEAKGGDLEESVEAIPVRYAGGYIAFYRNSSLLTDVSFISEAESTCSKGAVPAARRCSVGDSDGLHADSFVLIRETDKDALEQLADQYYLKDETVHTRQLAGLWRKGLDELYMRYSRDNQKVFDALKCHGMTKGYQAFKTLARDAEKIAPGRSIEEIAETVVAIARALHNPRLEAESSDIAKAALKVQTAHRRAGRMLSRTLGEQFGIYLADNGIAKPEDIWEPVTFDLGGLGEVSVYRITEIDRDRRVRVVRWKLGKVLDE